MGGIQRPSEKHSLSRAAFSGYFYGNLPQFFFFIYRTACRNRYRSIGKGRRALCTQFFRISPPDRGQEGGKKLHTSPLPTGPDTRTRSVQRT